MIYDIQRLYEQLREKLRAFQFALMNLRFWTLILTKLMLIFHHTLLEPV